MRKTLVAFRQLSEIQRPEVRAMLVEFVHDFRLIELDATPVQSNTLADTFAAQKAAAARVQAATPAQLHAGAVEVPVSQSPPTKASLLQLTPEAHAQLIFQVSSEILVVGECIGDKRKSEQIAPPVIGHVEDAQESVGHEGEGEKEEAKKKRAEVEIGQDENLSSARARKNMLQALNCRINSEKSSRCTSPAP